LCFLVAIGMAVPLAAAAQGDGGATSRIRLNQVGFYTRGPKVAVVADSTPTRFAILTVPGGDTVFRGALAAAHRAPLSNEVVRQADFSSLERPGRYEVDIPGIGRSPRFEISDTALRALARAVTKAFYYQRASTSLPVAYAGVWARAAGHPDTAVLVHPSAAGPTRPSGAVIRAAGGWYDAGDYNKYVVNSGISTYTLLVIAEHFPAYAAALRLDIPESTNGLPDVLDESLWNLRWMLAMQDPADGGVYHKLTNAEFDAFIPPIQAVAPRYVVQKSTAATLDFAAVTAHAALVVRGYGRELPALADSLVAAATAAWRWARAHPDVTYDQDRLNARYSPHILTGAYGDRTLDDEFLWAAAELYLATKQDSFLVAAAPVTRRAATVPGWPSVHTLALFSLLDHRRELPPTFDTTALSRQLLALATSLVHRVGTSAYGTSMEAADFVWGSNGVAANQGMVLVQAYRLTGDSAYLRAAIASLDHVLGRNATGYSFVTGFGTTTPQSPHHRLSASDTVVAPVPGLVAGGPNPGQQDHCPGYPSRLPALSYLDTQCSYASNEIAINWNAPLAYLAVAVDALMGSGRGGRH
jgi:endoglucanase